jgi:hypothetical protein
MWGEEFFPDIKLKEILLFWGNFFPLILGRNFLIKNEIFL